MLIKCSFDPTRYSDYRNPAGHEEEYDFAPIFWQILAARLAFVVVFEVKLLGAEIAIFFIKT